MKPFAARELLARVSAALHLARVREEASAALRESEERYRSLTEATAQVVWTMDADGRWRSPSPSFERYTGLTWEEYRDGSGRAVHPADHDRVTAEWATILRSASPGEIRFRFRRADGAYRRAISRAVPLRQSDGDIREWVGTITDMEDQVQAEERLRQAAKMEAIGRLAGGLAHDFNNQLQGIAGFAAFVDRDPGLSARARQDVHEIRKAAERMAGMTQQLLAFSRQQVLVAEVLDLNAAVADSQSLLQRLIGSSIEMVVQLAPGPKWVQVDRAQLLQVLMNLAINARDAMPAGGELVVRTATRTSVPEVGATDGPYAALMVSDSGSGISPEHLPHIFEPFFTTKETGEGTGLGLATVHGIVSHSRGQVWAESKPDKGTTFIVLLPLTQEPSRRDAAPARAIEQARPATVLVVDDEDIIRSLMKRTLEEAGYEVLLARNGREALDSLARHRGGGGSRAERPRDAGDGRSRAGEPAGGRAPGPPGRVGVGTSEGHGADRPRVGALPPEAAFARRAGGDRRPSPGAPRRAAPGDSGVSRGMTATDLRFALRRLRRHAAASIAATLTLALGVGAVTALFSVVRAVLLRPPPFRAPHELVAVDLHPAARPETRLEISYPDFRDWRARSRSFQDLAAHQTALGRVVWEGGGEPVPAAGFLVSGHFFDLLGVRSRDRPRAGARRRPARRRAGAGPERCAVAARARRDT